MFASRKILSKEYSFANLQDPRILTFQRKDLRFEISFREKIQLENLRVLKSSKVFQGSKRFSPFEKSCQRNIHSRISKIHVSPYCKRKIFDSRYPFERRLSAIRKFSSIKIEQSVPRIEKIFAIRKILSKEYSFANLQDPRISILQKKDLRFEISFREKIERNSKIFE